MIATDWRLEAANTMTGERKYQKLLSTALILLGVELVPTNAQEPASSEATPYTKMSKAEYEDEVIKLETWKANVQGTFMGDNLIKMLGSLDASVIRNPRDTQALFKRGYLYGTVGCTRAALVDLNKAINIDPMQASLYCERSLCYIDMAEYQRAESDLNMAIYLDPTSGDAYLTRGRLYLIQNRPDMAVADLLKCKDQRLEFKTVLPGELRADFYRAPDYYLGICYEMLGLPDQAVNCFMESSKGVSGSESGYIHRYADRPVDSGERIKRLKSG